MKFKMSMDGSYQTLQALDDLGNKFLTKVVRKGLTVGGEMLRQEVVKNAPRDTGFLAEHFVAKVNMGAKGGASCTVGPQGRMDYPRKGPLAYILKTIKGKPYNTGRISVASVARFFEFGTKKMAARPFMTASFDSVKAAVAEKFFQIFHEGLKELKRR